MMNVAFMGMILKQTAFVAMEVVSAEESADSEKQREVSAYLFLRHWWDYL